MSASKHRLTVPHDAVVLVCDGRKSLLFQNTGSPAAPKLHLLEHRDAPDNPPTRVQGADRPGRTDAGQSRRSAMGQTDWHDEAERAFAVEIARGLDEPLKKLPGATLVIVAAPRTLATLRDHLSDQSRAVLVGELAADLTKHTVADMEERLATKEAP